MTAAELIAQVDELEPNQYSEEMKLCWLSELDAQIYAEVVETHEDPIVDEVPGYDDTAEELLAPEPWCGELYRWFLISQMRLHNAESARYNQAVKAFAAAYQSFVDWYNRGHRPIGAGTRFVF